MERAFAAPPVEVFDAWTNPVVLTRWWAAMPAWTSPGCEVDLRVGGRYVLRMTDSETGQVHVVGGRFQEVSRPDRLVYTWCWEGEDGLHPGHTSLVTVEFRAEGDGTVVVLEHTELASAESVARHRFGWAGAFENLSRRVFGGAETITTEEATGMGNYVLAYRGGTMAETEEERNEVMAAWGAWFGSVGEALVDAGNPFAASASVSAGGTVTEGAGSGLGGYSIVKAESLEAATGLAKGCPVLGGGGTVDVYETIVVG